MLRGMMARTLLVNGTYDLECGSTTNNSTRAKDVAFATIFGDVKMLRKEITVDEGEMPADGQGSDAEPVAAASPGLPGF